MRKFQINQKASMPPVKKINYKGHIIYTIRDRRVDANYYFVDDREDTNKCFRTQYEAKDYINSI